MPLNDRKIISIFIEQCSEIEERFEGYRQEIAYIISDIVEYERQHRVQGTNIQKKINDKFNAAGRLLAEKRGEDVSMEGEDS